MVNNNTKRQNTQKGGGTSAQIEHLPASSLVPYARNSRTHSESQIAQIAGSITEFGFTNPVLIDKDGGIIAGHGRVLAAIQLGMDSVPCLRLSHLTDAQKRAYVIADNQLALNSEWDEEMLEAELATLGEMDFDLRLLGFTEEVNQGYEEAVDYDTEPRIDEAKELMVVWGTKEKQVWSIGNSRLMCGDSTDPKDVSRLLAGNSPQIMVTDPPYGVSYDPSWRKEAGINKSNRMGVVENDHVADWTEAWRLFPGAVAYVWHGGLHSGTVQGSLTNAGFTARAQVIWVKPRLVMSRGHYHWQHEPCWVAEKEELAEDSECEEAWYAVRKNSTAGWEGGRKQTTVWNIGFSGEVKTTHGTQKPVECMARPIRNHSLSKSGVYDPFCGSGTTLMAAEQLNRICYCMEISPAYVAVILQRFQDATGVTPTLVNDV